jgi:hypothetical protein
MLLIIIGIIAIVVIVALFSEESEKDIEWQIRCDTERIRQYSDNMRSATQEEIDENWRMIKIYQASRDVKIAKLEALRKK